MRTVVSLLMISLGSPLLFNDHVSSSSAAAAKSCVSLAQINAKAARFLRTNWPTEDAPRPGEDRRTCEQAAREIRGELRNRSLSPWIYRVNREDDRFPRDIFFAECLCTGCIINTQEDMRYNSVQMFAQRMVMRRIQCTSNQNKYMLNKEFIRVPVGCTCAVPKSVNG